MTAGSPAACKIVGGHRPPLQDSRSTFMAHLRWFALAAMVIAVAAFGQQQQPVPRPGISVPPLGDGPFVFDTGEQHKIRIVVVTKGLSHPWSLAFLPDGN